jgi:ketosteroid isomerase-like protein
MSSNANAQITERFFGHFLADEIDQMMDMQTDDVVWDICDGAAAETVPYFGTWKGREGCLACLEAYDGAADPQVFEIERYLGDGDKGFALGHETVRAKPTDKTFTTDFNFMLTIRDGKVAGLKCYIDSAALITAFAPRSGRR